MSSRELLVLLRWPIKDGPYERARRDGEWPAETQLLKEIHKELALYRASQYVGGPDEYQPTLYMSPGEAAKHAAQVEADEQFAREATDEFEDLLFG